MIIANDPQRVAAWAGERLGCSIVPPYDAIGVEHNGEIKGAIVINDYSDRNVELTIVGEPGAFSRGFTRAMAWHVFVKLDCRRVTMRTRARNAHARDLIERLGGVQEGILRDWYSDDDAVIYGIYRGDCKWLNLAAFPIQG